MGRAPPAWQLCLPAPLHPPTPPFSLRACPLIGWNTGSHPLLALPDLIAYEEEVADRGDIEGLAKTMTEEGEGGIVKMPNE